MKFLTFGISLSILIDAKESLINTIELPVVNLNDASQLPIVIKSLQQYGAVFIQDANFDLQPAFHAASQLLKSSQSSSASKGPIRRGYIPLLAESGGRFLEIKESFAYGMDISNATNPLEGINIWPQGFTKQTILEDLFIKFTQIAKQFASRFLERFDTLPKLESFYGGGEKISFIRIFHYFSTSSSEFASNCIPDGKLPCTGSSPHTDWGFLTLIASHNYENIDIYLNDAWHSVKPAPTTSTPILINAGDFLSLISQGGAAIKSPRHRVRLGPEPRTSLVYFFYPNFDTPFDRKTSAECGDLSLFENQREFIPSHENNDLISTFGQFIVEKWDQVSRISNAPAPPSLNQEIS